MYHKHDHARTHSAARAHTKTRTHTHTQTNTIQASGWHGMAGLAVGGTYQDVRSHAAASQRTRALNAVDLQAQAQRSEDSFAREPDLALLRGTVLSGCSVAARLAVRA